MESKSQLYERELRVAQLAVQRAAIMTRRVFREKAKGTVDKDDKSPVTIGDFGAQALITAALQHNFPSDEIVAEEEAAKLRKDTQLRDTVWELVRDTRLEDGDAEKEVLGGAVGDANTMMDLIDRGGSRGGAKGRIWTIDPIDGTKGFLRGGQYAVCLALMVDGHVKVGVLGCPNLPVDGDPSLMANIGTVESDQGRGVLFSAVSGHGATCRPLTAAGLAPSQPISMRAIESLAEASMCESVEAGHSSHDLQADISRLLGIAKPSVRMDSQAKYGSIARGAGDVYLRLPTSKTYREKIWDHAAGDLIVTEAGGRVSDIFGQALDFGRGRTLQDNRGVVACRADLHAHVISRFRQYVEQKREAKTPNLLVELYDEHEKETKHKLT
ncbi:3'(2'),5'-bisphosphate nucleotidase [Hirsutella minnesotensis 3608]|uniref:3'(2'),5'-bisphosphate nucleotidase n=1 Tax=Hirsutella minnesotensis 3608 TaxID=1043627 RepID=A0A0F8A539_9HYPO|nr:3'(2'),5'-bisphosphate nucleotidase [Hirsutella minnesotensis 3608]